MNVLDEIGITAFDVQEFTRRAINLNTPIALNKDELYHSFVRPKVDSINFGRDRRRDVLSRMPYRKVLKLINWKPVFRLGRAAFESVGKNNAAAVFFPAKKQAGNGDYKEKDEKGSASCAMDFTGKLKNVRPSFPR